MRCSISFRGLGQQQLFEQFDFLGIVRVDALEQASQGAAQAFEPLLFVSGERTQSLQRLVELLAKFGVLRAQSGYL